MSRNLDFSDRPFVAGSLIGIRSFGVSETGYLTGVVQKVRYNADENHAACIRPERLLNNMMIQLGGEVGARAEAREAAHSLIALDCFCGFYAYFNGNNPYSGTAGAMFDNKSGVTGLIEGYGRTVVGSKGFRAEKARIVAIVFGLEKNEMHRNLHPILRLMRGLRPTPLPRADQWALIKSHYPDVPLYASVEEALAAHPLTVPDPEVV